MGAEWTEERILEAARREFAECGAGLTVRDFLLRTRIPESRIISFFGGWLALKKRVGQEPRPVVPERSDPLRRPAVLVELVRSYALEHGVGFGLTEFCRATGMSRQTVFRNCGSWRALRQAAGLTPRPAGRKELSDEQIVADLVRVLRDTKAKRLSCDLYDAYGRVGVRTVLRRFGSWERAKDAMYEYAGLLTEWFSVPADRMAHVERVTAGLGGKGPRCW